MGRTRASQQFSTRARKLLEAQIRERGCRRDLSDQVEHTPDGRYRVGGISAGGFWYVIKLGRFEVGELDDLVPGLRLPDDASFLDLPPWTARLADSPPPPPGDKSPGYLEGAG